MDSNTYVVTFGMYNRAFGEAPHTTQTIEATSLEQAQQEADRLSREDNPDSYVVDVKLKVD